MKRFVSQIKYETEKNKKKKKNDAGCFFSIIQKTIKLTQLYTTLYNIKGFFFVLQSVDFSSVKVCATAGGYNNSTGT